MSSLYIDGVNAPDEIVEQLRVLSKDIKFKREVTKGGNGYLFFGKNKILRKKVAVKFYYWGGNKKFHAEPSTLANIDSPHVLDVQNAGLINGSWAYFVTPYCVNGDMDDVIDRTDIGNIKSVNLVCQLLMGVGTLHEKRYLHRDLKPANIYIGDEFQAIIGDFGSIKYLPESSGSIPASGHAVLYRPPESITTNSYGFEGDIYQSGIVLYQLLGGILPYDEVSWLLKPEKKHYDQLSTEADKSIYADQCLKTKIEKGKILNINSLPPWVPSTLKRVIRRATNVNPSKRYPSASAFHIQLNNLKAAIPNWVIDNGVPTLFADTSYKIFLTDGNITVKKRRGEGQWRKDNSFKVGTLKEAVDKINKKI